MVCNCMACYGHVMVWMANVMAWHGTARNVAVWYGMVWYGMVAVCVNMYVYIYIHTHFNANKIHRYIYIYMFMYLYICPHTSSCTP